MVATRRRNPVHDPAVGLQGPAEPLQRSERYLYRDRGGRPDQPGAGRSHRVLHQYARPADRMPRFTQQPRTVGAGTPDRAVGLPTPGSALREDRRDRGPGTRPEPPATGECAVRPAEYPPDPLPAPGRSNAATGKD